jgi:hypothetical protein
VSQGDVVLVMKYVFDAVENPWIYAKSVKGAGYVERRIS